jgi:nucleotide-binding universal stress UspA family protein
MKKRFIVLIDFSKYSSNLIRYACDWGQKINAELMLVHQTIVLAPALTDKASREDFAQYAYDEAMQQLRALTEELIPPTVKVSYKVSERNLQHTLNKLLEDPLKNLIFVGLKGTGILKKIFLGTVALQVINNTKNCIVAMPGEVTGFSHEKIFVAVSDKHPINVLELNNFLQFIDKEHTSITFFHISKPYEKTKGIEKQLGDLTELFADRYNTKYSIYAGDNPFDDVKKVINNKIEEILIVQKGSRLLTDQLFRKFLINELVYEGQTPLIVLP